MFIFLHGDLLPSSALQGIQAPWPETLKPCFEQPDLFPLESYSIVSCRIVWYCTVWYRTEQNSTVQYSIV